MENRPSPVPWTEAEIERLLTMWKAGTSAVKIAAELGRSRNSVLGRLWRAGMVEPLARKAERLRQPRPDLWVRGPRRPPRAALVIAPEPKRLWELAAGECHFPVGEEVGHRQLFCAGTRCEGRPYCAQHVKLARKR